MKARRSAEPWYGVRSVYRWPKPGRAGRKLYEERIVLVRARTENHALAVAEQEARRYARQNNVKYLGLLQSFHIFSDEVRHRTEAFSLLRDSSLRPDAYIKRHFSTGLERQRVD